MTNPNELAITGAYIPHLSWQREHTFKLSNGWIAGVSWSESYQMEFIKGLSKDDVCWRASDGISGLPPFAHDWINKGSDCSSLKDTVLVGFEKVW